MIDCAGLYAAMARESLRPWPQRLPDQLAAAFGNTRNGELEAWVDAIARLPGLTPSSVDLAGECLRVGTAQDCSDAERGRIESLLRRLHPWRKGPYSVFGIDIDTEWRSDWKWERLRPHLQPIDGRLVLDVGCGNGYHCWRSAGEGARLVIGIDPSMRSVMQFQALRHFVTAPEVYVLPLAIEQVPANLDAFDTVLSMGVLYHRRSPIDHLVDLRGCLRRGGELVLETLVIDGAVDQLLMPEGRYACMRNVWFIPSVPMLERWLRRSGFVDVRTVDVTPTSLDEQRSTSWMTFQSLPDFLEVGDRKRTVEGLPAPTRAIVLATRS